jgi:hypothetical protein
MKPVGYTSLLFGLCTLLFSLSACNLGAPDAAATPTPPAVVPSAVAQTAPTNTNANTPVVVTVIVQVTAQPPPAQPTAAQVAAQPTAIIIPSNTPIPPALALPSNTPLAVAPLGGGVPTTAPLGGGGAPLGGGVVVPAAGGAPVVSSTANIVPSAVSLGVTNSVDYNGITFQYNSTLSGSWFVEIVPARPAGPSVQPFEVAPSYYNFTFPAQPNAYLRVYPTANFAPMASFGAPYTTAQQTLTTLLAQRQPINAGALSGVTYTAARLPFLPLLNTPQVFTTRPGYLAFNGGDGVRYLTYFAPQPQAMLEGQLWYTYQGITSDGRYYVAAVFPLTTGVLPATQPPSFNVGTYPAYLNEQILQFNTRDAGGFAPSVNTLDALMSSIRITR